MATQEFINRVGAMIRLKRKRSLLTMEAVGRKNRGLSKGYLSGIENGKVNPPSWGMARALASALGFPVDDFASLCEIVKLPDAVLKRPRITEEIEALFGACGEEETK